MLQPDSGHVHVWRIPLEVSVAVLDRYRSYLSPDERERASRYRFERHARRFVVARGSLRALLASYLHERPADLAFAVSPYGKPRLWGREGLQFNTTHSHELALCAVGRQELGIDVEWVRPLPSMMHIASQSFHPREVVGLRQMGGDGVERAFFRCWSRKEAYIKAVGQGLSIPLDSFAVSIGDDACLLESGGESADGWRIVNLDAGPDYAAALAVAAPEIHIDDRLWEHAGAHPRWLAAGALRRS